MRVPSALLAPTLRPAWLSNSALSAQLASAEQAHVRHEPQVWVVGGSLEERQRKTFPSARVELLEGAGPLVVPRRTERVASLIIGSSPSTPPGRPAARRHTAEIGTEPCVGGDSLAWLGGMAGE